MNALARKAPASACSSSSPAIFQRIPRSCRFSASIWAVTATRTASACTPSVMPAATVTVRAPSIRVSVPVEGTGSRVTRFEIGIEPSGVSIRNWSSIDSVRMFSGSRNRMSTASSLPAGR